MPTSFPSQVNRRLESLVAAFAAGPEGRTLPNCYTFRALPDRRFIRPLFVFLHNDHFTTLIAPRRAPTNALPEFPIVWLPYLAALSRQFPLPDSDEGLSQLISSL